MGIGRKQRENDVNRPFSTISKLCVLGVSVCVCRCVCRSTKTETEWPVLPNKLQLTTKLICTEHRYNLFGRNNQFNWIVYSNINACHLDKVSLRITRILWKRTDDIVFSKKVQNILNATWILSLKLSLYNTKLSLYNIHRAPMFCSSGNACCWFIADFHDILFVYRNINVNISSFLLSSGSGF